MWSVVALGSQAGAEGNATVRHRNLTKVACLHPAVSFNTEAEIC